MATAALPPTSRYAGIEVAVYRWPDGRESAYFRRRLPPPPERLSLVAEHVVTDSDRIDRIAYDYLRDPEQFWRICDANRAMRPADLTAVVGRRLRITLPDGIPGLPHA
jgi:hypothetical protein